MDETDAKEGEGDGVGLRCVARGVSGGLNSVFAFVGLEKKNSFSSMGAAVWLRGERMEGVAGVDGCERREEDRTGVVVSDRDWRQQGSVHIFPTYSSRFTSRRPATHDPPRYPSTACQARDLDTLSTEPTTTALENLSTVLIDVQANLTANLDEVELVLCLQRLQVGVGVQIVRYCARVPMFG
jgi:hypothetical protein